MASVSASDVKQIVVACEAGMGSSVMVARQLAKQLKSQGITVVHSPVNQLAETPHEIVLVHRGLSARAKQAVPQSVVIIFDMFLGDLNIAKLVGALQNGDTISDGCFTPTGRYHARCDGLLARGGRQHLRLAPG
jgi:mannitol-specific phosphotransferase system IIBC component